MQVSGGEMKVGDKVISKKCKICKKLLRQKNKSLLCAFHYTLNWMKGGKNGR